MPLQAIADLYGRPRTAGYTGSGADASRAAVIPGYGSQISPDERHGRWGDRGGPASAAPGWDSRGDSQTAYTGGWVLTDDEPEAMGAETAPFIDRTPYPATTDSGYAGRGQHRGYGEAGAAPDPGISSHAAPYPRTWLRAGSTRPDMGPVDERIDDQLTEQEARHQVHAVDLGAGRTGWGNAVGGHESPVRRRDVYYTSQGHSDLHRVTDPQIRGSGGMGTGASTGGQGGTGNDEVQGYGQPNQYGYGDAHIQNYRQQTDPVPYNYQWLNVSERAFIPKGQLTNQATGQTFDGPDSPYGPAGDQTQYATVLTVSPASPETPGTAYQAPPDPVMAPAAVTSADDDVWAW